MGRRVIPATYTSPTTQSEIKERGLFPPSATANAVDSDDYASRLVKYVPAEIVTLFVTLNSMVTTNAAEEPWLQWAVFGILLVITPIYTNHLTKAANMPPAYKQIIIATLSFIFWVFAIGGPFVQMFWYKSIYGTILLPIYTFVVPMLDSAESTPTPPVASPNEENSVG